MIAWVIVAGLSCASTRCLSAPAAAHNSLAYYALDAVTRASDFKAAVTSYGRYAQGNATAEASAGVGPRSTQ